MERQTPRFKLTPRPSFQLACLVVGLHALALLSLALLPWPWWLRLPLALLVGLSSHSALRCHVRNTSRRSVLGFGCDGEQWFVHTPVGRLKAVLQEDSVCLPAIIVLRFQTSRGVLSSILLPDSAPAAELRRLRVLLRVRARQLLPPARPPLWRRCRAWLVCRFSSWRKVSAEGSSTA